MVCAQNVAERLTLSYLGVIIMIKVFKIYLLSFVLYSVVERLPQIVWQKVKVKHSESI